MNYTTKLIIAAAISVFIGVLLMSSFDEKKSNTSNDKLSQVDNGVDTSVHNGDSRPIKTPPSSNKDDIDDKIRKIKSVSMKLNSENNPGGIDESLTDISVRLNDTLQSYLKIIPSDDSEWVDMISESNNGGVESSYVLAKLKEHCFPIKHWYCHELEDMKFFELIEMKAHEGDLFAMYIYWDSIKVALHNGEINPTLDPLLWYERQNYAMQLEEQFIMNGYVEKAFQLGMDLSGKLNAVIKPDTNKSIAFLRIAEISNEPRARRSIEILESEEDYNSEKVENYLIKFNF